MIGGHKGPESGGNHEGPQYFQPQPERPSLTTGIEQSTLRGIEVRPAERLRETRAELNQAGAISSQAQRAQLLQGDFFGIGELERNRLILPPGIAEEVRQVSQAYTTEHRVINPFYFVDGNKTATDYNGNARNRSTITGIKTLTDGRRIFLIDPKWSSLHRWSDTALRRLSGSPARKVSTSEWQGVFMEKSRIPVLQSDNPNEAGTFPYKNLIALPFIPNVNGFDYFAGKETILFPAGYEWAKQAGVDEKLTVAKNAMFELSRIHAGNKAWGEPAAHNMLIADQGRNVIIVDPEVLYDDGVPLEEAQARDILDLTVSIAGGLHASGAIKSSEYPGVVDEIFSVYPEKEVLTEVGRLCEPMSGIKRLLYPIYEQKRMNNLPLKQYKLIKAAIQKVV